MHVFLKIVYDNLVKSNMLKTILACLYLVDSNETHIGDSNLTKWNVFVQTARSTHCKHTYIFS